MVMEHAPTVLRVFREFLKNGLHQALNMHNIREQNNKVFGKSEQKRGRHFQEAVPLMRKG